MDDALRPLSLTTPQFAALSALAEEPGLSGARLARRCFVTPQTMTGIVGNLIAANLVTREPDPEHGRVLQVRLTRPGTEVFEHARRRVEEIEERMVADLDRAEREALADLLAQCADALERR
ncbi:MAG TPA: MarR family transcriptional regulator [Xanthobacteraceae bacterium]|nr:MarR family transcriptional regulator [Xanthobacteraceae bacterium]